MPGTTSRLALPYATPDDTVDVPRDIKALTDKLDPLAATFVQGTAATRPAAGVAGRYHYATDSGALSYDTGSAWLGVAGPTPSNIPLVSVLPATPVDGQEVYFLANATDGVVWHLRYRTGGGVYWECVGGPPLCTPPINDSLTLGSGASWSTQLGDGTGAVGINVPLPGDYFCTWNASAQNAAASTITTGAGVLRSQDTGTPYQSAVQTLYGNGQWANCGGSGRFLGVLAGSRLNMAYLYGPNQISFTRRNMTAMPIRVFKP